MKRAKNDYGDGLNKLLEREWEKAVPKTVVRVTAVWTRRSGDYVETLVEVDGEWKLVSREHVEGSFSHIAEGNGAENWKDDPLG